MKITIKFISNLFFSQFLIKQNWERSHWFYKLIIFLSLGLSPIGETLAQAPIPVPEPPPVNNEVNEVNEPIPTTNLNQNQEINNFQIIPVTTNHQNFSTNERTNPSAFRLRRGDRGKIVTDLQQTLLNSGINPGGVDGIFGVQTEEAVRQFQRQQGLRDDGIVDTNTLRLLTQTILASNNNINQNFNQPVDNSSTIIASYLVIIPTSDQETLTKVKQKVPDAFIGYSYRGEYIQAGAFSNREAAESQSADLRTMGLDARVIYR